MRKWLLLRESISKYKVIYLVGILALIGVDILQLLMPYLLGVITDKIKAGTINTYSIFIYGIYFVLIAIGVALGRFIWRFCVFGTSKKIENELRLSLFKKLLNLSSSYYDKHKTGDLMSHATNDIGNVSMATGQGVALIFDSLLIPIIASVLMITTVGWKLTLASFLPMLILAAIMMVFVKIMYGTINNMQEAISNMTEVARESFSGIRIIKAFVQEKAIIEKFEKANNHNKKMNFRFALLMSTLFPIVMTVSSFAFAVALWYGGILVLNKEISLGSFISFNGYLGMLIWPIAALGWMVSLFQRGNVSLDRISKIMYEKPEIQDITLSQDNISKKLTSIQNDKIININGEINIFNLNFTYPETNKPVLKNISFKVQRGKTLAIVGRTGSGKSTLVSLLSRLYDAPDDSIFYDEVSIKEIPITILRENVACVPQETFLFSGKISSNIDFYSNKQKDEIEKYAKIARIHENILDFPDGYNTITGERGITLSGGQKQRIAIARALICQPKVLILDDCLSAVDAKTEKEILKELKIFMKERTSVVVSHRISAIKDSDSILVLEDGEMVGLGTHEELLDKCRQYREMHTRQILEEKVMEVDENV